MRIKINGSYYTYFNDFAMSSSIDSVAATFSFTAYFNPDNKDHLKLFKPLSYYPVQFEDDKGNVFFTGTIVDHKFNDQSAPDLVQVSGYSKGGVLEDCTIPVSKYPLESINRSIADIANRMAGIFGLKVLVYSNVAKECSQQFEKSVAGATDKVKDYLTKVAAQKNVLLSHDASGRVILFRPDTTAKPKYLYTPDNTTNIKGEYAGQSLHSEIAAIRQQKADDDTEGGEGIGQYDVLKNNLVQAYRPVVQVLTSGSQTDTLSGAKNLFASELKNLKVSVSINGRWDNVNNGDIVEVISPRAYLPRRTRLMVASITRNENADGRSMSLALVLPETFTGESPKNIFS